MLCFREYANHSKWLRFPNTHTHMHQKYYYHVYFAAATLLIFLSSNLQSLSPSLSRHTHMLDVRLLGIHSRWCACDSMAKFAFNCRSASFLRDVHSMKHNGFAFYYNPHIVPSQKMANLPFSLEIFENLQTLSHSPSRIHNRPIRQWTLLHSFFIKFGFKCGRYCEYRYYYLDIVCMNRFSRQNTFGDVLLPVWLIVIITIIVICYDYCSTCYYWLLFLFCLVCNDQLFVSEHENHTETQSIVAIVCISSDDGMQ